MADNDEIKYIRLKDFQSLVVTGTTSATANTTSKFRHGANQVPAYWIVQEGDVFVPRNGADQNIIDVQSAKTSQPFKLLLIY
jgi:hypothetical protein